jgi:hypothetical protein
MGIKTLEIIRAGSLVLASLSLASCMSDPQLQAGEQAVVNPPLPSNLNLTLNAKTSVTIGPSTQVQGDMGSSGATGSALVDVNVFQGFGRYLLANKVTVRFGAFAGLIVGNVITVDGSSQGRTLGLDPAAMPQVPALTASVPGTTNISVAVNQSRQLCPGQYGAISLGRNATLNLNGGVYQISRLTLADGARLEPSEPAVILVSGALLTGIGSAIVPSPQALTSMTARQIRIEVGTNATLGDSTEVRAHVLVPNGKFATATNARLSGAAWAKTISIGAQNSVIGEDVFSLVTPEVPPPCNDHNSCTADRCVGGGTAAATCSNTPVPTGTSCADGNLCNGDETCNGSGTCTPGINADAGTSCADGTLCNGDETCNGGGACIPGAPPVVTDGNTCTTDTCDPATGVSNAPLPDGTSCSGVGTCEAGTCSIQGTVFSENFIRFSDAPQQCTSWNNFRANLVNSEYSQVSMSGTFDLGGITCTDPVAATRICRALNISSFDSVSCGGHVWNVGSCGGAELSIDAGTCSCRSPGRTVRPCTGFGDWGGVNTSTCSGPDQNMTVLCK